MLYSIMACKPYQMFDPVRLDNFRIQLANHTICGFRALSELQDSAYKPYVRRRAPRKLQDSAYRPNQLARQ